MKSLYLFLLSSLLLSGCQTTPDQKKQANTIAQVSKTLPIMVQNTNKVAGKTAIPIIHQQQQYWLLSSESQGILLTDNAGNLLASFAGNMETLDWRDNIRLGNKNVGLIVTHDTNAERILVLTLDWQTQQLSLLTTLPKTDAQIEALCWYQMPQGHLSVFIADTVGSIQQRIMVDGKHQALVDVPVHEFIGAPQTKACAVDDETGALYVVEENIGLWRYSAETESELARELVIAVAPFGPLEGEITGVDVLANGGILVAAPEHQGVWMIKSESNENATFIPLGHTQAPESVRGLQQPSSLILGIFDDENGEYLQTNLKTTAHNRQKLNSDIVSINAFAQTKPMEAFGDAADDPAIWINPLEPSQSRILGTNKKQGMMVYDLHGNLLQKLDVGRVNNVDLRYGFEFAKQTFDLAAASNRTTNSISLFSIQQNSGELSLLTDIKTDLADVYGLCMYQQKNDYYVFVNDTDGRFQQYLLVTENEQITGKLVREFKVPSQPEGCVADDKNHQLYYGEESTGIWQTSAQPTKQLGRLIAITSDTFVADVEGMGIYVMDDQRYLVASSQGNNSFGVFALDQDNRYLGSFQIDMNLDLMLDGVSETDGLEITSLSLGSTLPDGLLVVQDGRNRLPNAPQNFKLVDGKVIKRLIQKWLSQ